MNESENQESEAEAIGRRIRDARKRKGMNIDQVGDAIGVSRGTVGHWETGARGVKTSVLKRLAEVLECPIEELLYGKPTTAEIIARYDVPRFRRALPSAGEVVDVPYTDLKVPTPPRHRVPLISFVQAGEMVDVSDPFRPGEADEWVPIERRVGPNAFALRVSGDSMTAPYGQHSFPEGTLIIVDPGQAAGPGDFVVAKDVGTQSATFKRLMHDGGRWFLKPLNPAYPAQEIDREELRIIGKVVAARSETWL